MSLYAIADLHLSFADGVNKPMDKFGSEWKNHAERLKLAWEEVVKPEDTVIIPGDISWAISLEEAKPDLEFIDALPGKKVLLRGNHDYWWASMKKMRGLYKTIDFIQNDVYICEDCVICGTRGWLLPWHPSADFSATESAKIFKRELLRMEMSLEAAKEKRNEKKLIVAMHFPPLDVDHTGTQFTELFQHYGVDIVIYGHLHGAHKQEAAEGKIGGIEYKLVSLDRLDAKPCLIL